MKLLLIAGADVNAQGGIYGNALHAASEKGYKQIAKILLDVGANINAQSWKHGNTLHTAAYLGKDAMLELLLSKIDITQLQDPYNRTLFW